jgi:hypothetical protein
MYVNEQKKTIFIAHPRTASSATGHILLEMGFVIQGNHHSFDTELNLHGWTVASTVRNPFDTLVSWYYNKPREASFKDWLPIFLNSCHFLQGPRMFYGTLYCTHVLRFEELQYDFNCLCQDIGLPRTMIPKRNVSNRPLHFLGEYDYPDLKLITERFRDEFIEHNYIGINTGRLRRCRSRIQN